MSGRRRGSRAGPGTATKSVPAHRPGERWDWTGRLGGLGAAGAPGTPGLRAPLRIGGATKARTGSCWGPSLPSRCGLGRRPEAATCYTPLRLRRQAWRPPAAHGSPRLVPIPVPARAHRGPAWLTRGPAAPRLAPDAYPGTWRVDLQQDLHHDVPRVLVALAMSTRTGTTRRAAIAKDASARAPCSSARHPPHHSAEK